MFLLLKGVRADKEYNIFQTKLFVQLSLLNPDLSLSERDGVVSAWVEHLPAIFNASHCAAIVSDHLFRFYISKTRQLQATVPKCSGKNTRPKICTEKTRP